MYEPRDYQWEEVNTVMELMKLPSCKNSVVVSPTGAGKSLVIAKVVHLLGDEPCLIIQPAVELLKQNYAKLVGYGGKATLYSASVNSKVASNTTYATINSIKDSGKEFKRLGVKKVIIDECHFKMSPDDSSMISKFLKDLKPTHVIGFTASPIRMGVETMGFVSKSKLKMLNRTSPTLFPDIVHVTPISTMVEGKYWASMKYEQWDFDESTLKMNSTGSDFTEYSIKQALMENGVMDNVYLRIKALDEEGKSALVFTGSVDEAVQLASKFGNKAAYVTGKTPKGERNQIVEDFKSGKLKFVFNYGTFVVGFDHPELDVVIMARPTNSLAVYYQIVGRVCRNPLYPEQKQALVIDFCNNTKRFGRIEDLEFKDYKGYGWGCFNQTHLISGVPMDCPMSIDDLERSINTKLSNMADYVVEFGKHRGERLSTLPMSYRTWMLDNIKDLGGVRAISKADLRSQLLTLLVKPPELSEDGIIAVDFKNIAYILHKANNLSPEGLEIYLGRLKNALGYKDIRVFCDSDSRTYWRKAVYTEYKNNRASRKPQPESFKKGMKDIITNYPNLMMKDGYEADDLIAELVRTSDKPVFVVSSDGDFAQLAFFNNFKQFNPLKKEYVATTKYKALESLITKILKGDAKDNVKKCHNEGRIMTKDLVPLCKECYTRVVRYVRTNGVKSIEQVPLEKIIKEVLCEKYSLNNLLFKQNFQLLCLIQKQY